MEEKQLPNKKASDEEVLAYALEKYSGDRDKAHKYLRGWRTGGK